MVKGHHLKLRCDPMLFHNFKCFNIKTASAYCPVIQKEVGEVAAKATDGTEFFFNVCVLSKCTGGWWPILNH